jgi:hypothetical protein
MAIDINYIDSYREGYTSHQRFVDQYTLEDAADYLKYLNSAERLPDTNRKAHLLGTRDAILNHISDCITIMFS